jgi:hypothetical protein
MEINTDVLEKFAATVLRAEDGSNKFPYDFGSAVPDWMAAQPRKQAIFTVITVRTLCLSRFTLSIWVKFCDRFCGIVVRVPGYRSRGLGSIPGTTKFSKK